MHIQYSNLDKKIIKEKLSKKKIEKINKQFIEKYIIKKPWGFEYCFWSSKKAALWVLFIKKEQCTSLHSHIFKKTYLINSKKIFLKTLIKTNKIEPFSIIEIDKKTFHQTRNISGKDSVMFELETPNRKLDLLRHQDKYKRDSVFYEREILNNKSSINLKNNINKKFLEIFEGKKIKTFKKIKKNNILTLISGSLKLKNKKVKLHKPLKVNMDIVLKKNENFTNFTKIILIKSPS